MATLVKEPVQLRELREMPAGTTTGPRETFGRELAHTLGACMQRLGEFVLGVVLWLAGILVHLALAAGAVLAVPVALVLTVLLFALMIWGAGAVLHALGLT
ncbi:MAG TPA: hypothetical protein VNK04_20000 [Gemmataceae bacterium]|nr:hypothetical protein [Gemmataceae bacterium]